MQEPAESAGAVCDVTVRCYCTSCQLKTLNYDCTGMTSRSVATAPKPPENVSVESTGVTSRECLVLLHCGQLKTSECSALGK